MTAIKDLTNKKFGKLLALEIVGKDKYGRCIWKCLCNCGNETNVRSGNLIQKNSLSCGCHRKNKKKKLRLPYGEAAFNDLYGRYKYKAEKRGYTFILTKDETKILFKQNCYYCGQIPNKVRKKSECRGEFVYNGIDRVDGAEGYILSNCVTCCWECNSKKGSITKHMIIKAYEFLHKKER